MLSWVGWRKCAPAIEHGTSDVTARPLSSWQVLFIFSSSFQLFSDPAKLAANVGSKCFIFITDKATGSADLALGFSWLHPWPWLASQPQAPGDIYLLQIGQNKLQGPFLKVLSLGEANVCNPFSKAWVSSVTPEGILPKVRLLSREVIITYCFFVSRIMPMSHSC